MKLAQDLYLSYLTYIQNADVLFLQKRKCIYIYINIRMRDVRKDKEIIQLKHFSDTQGKSIKYVVSPDTYASFIVIFLSGN